MGVANQNQSNHNSQSDERKRLQQANHMSKKKTSELSKARENAGDQVAIGFSFESDWLREWRKFSGRQFTKINRMEGFLDVPCTLHIYGTFFLS